MIDAEKLRSGIIKSLSPQIDLFEDQKLRQKVIDAWALALSETQFKSLDELSCSTLKGALYYPGATQSDHQRAVGLMARSLGEIMIKMHGKEVIAIDLDIALACGLCHDLGKPFFYDENNRSRWLKNQPFTGNPPYRHTMKGAMLAMQSGLPEEVVAAIMNHDVHMEGQYVMISVYTELVYRADVAYWHTLKILGHMKKEAPVEGIAPGITSC